MHGSRNQRVRPKAHCIDHRLGHQHFTQLGIQTDRLGRTVQRGAGTSRVVKTTINCMFSLSVLRTTLLLKRIQRVFYLKTFVTDPLNREVQRAARGGEMVGEESCSSSFETSILQEDMASTSNKHLGMQRVAYILIFMH